MYYPKPIDRFELIQELRLHLRVKISPHLHYGWVLLTPSGDEQFFPPHGSSITLKLGDKKIFYAFSHDEIDIFHQKSVGNGNKWRTVASGKEKRLIAIPSDVQLFIKWIEHEFKINAAIKWFNSKELPMNDIPDVMKLYGHIVGLPDRNIWTLTSGYIREIAISDTELDDDNYS